ncbi:MraY family glycosyltransferase [Microvirga massiliensis]|uniref:MraY family glycosyltransferase n=1 Tax=Microvirga massiliensis TaxID=1033741 RepID=UPI003CC80848
MLRPDSPALLRLPMPELIYPAVAAVSAGLCALLIIALHPLLVRYAMARPNARSSHRVPTPQGGGLAVIAATFFVAGAILVGTGQGLAGPASVAAAGALLALLGAVDDIKPLPAVPRLLVQFFAVTTVVVASEVQIFPEAVPSSVERAILVFAGVWFVNLVNFMDGIDWITVAEVVPITAFLACLGVVGLVPPVPAIAAASLCGAMLGFAPFNRPVARLFLGDVGSLPIGLILGWLLLELATTGAIVAAILLPLYYLADATITLLRRLVAGERIWEAHRTHFYQRASDHGFSMLAVSGRVFGLNIVLAVLAGVTILWPQPAVQMLALAAGVVAVTLQLRRFAGYGGMVWG